MKCAISCAVGGAVVAATVCIAPPASADVVFVNCQFAVAKPFIYSEGDQQYVASRMDATNCQTNLPSTPITFEFDISPSTQQADGSWKATTFHYLATVEVTNGGSYSVQFPNDGQRIPLVPGGYLASGTATSSLPGYEAPQHVAAEMMSWGVPSL